MVDRQDAWKLDAACRGEDTAIFFPHGGTLRDRLQTAKAKAICDACPVTNECLEYGWREPFGTWGGMSQRERLLARREEYRRERAWTIALALVTIQVDVPPSRYNGNVTQTQMKRQAEL
jgi:WhiB family redox-sensing transcriptional regulator